MIEPSNQQQSSYIPPEGSEKWYISIIFSFISIILSVFITIPIYLIIDYLFGNELAIAISSGVAASLFFYFLPQEEISPNKIRQLIMALLSKESRLKSNRDDILYRVYKIWIKDNLLKNTKSGVFDNSKQIKPEAVLKQKNYDDYLLPENSIGKIFYDMGCQLLILGKPGAGKTILLLQLAYYLLGEAQNDTEKSLPVVLSLSSWYPKSFESWVSNQIHKTYNIPLNTIKDYLSKNQFIFLLDGLDEVYPKHQDQCIESLNNYCVQNPNTKFVVCCRVEDYEILTKKLNLNGAIELKDLTTQQIINYISGEKYNGISELVKNEDVPVVIFTTPFLLNTVKLAYANMPYLGNPFNQLKLNNETEENRINHLLDKFVEASIKQSIYPHKKLRKYLVWLTKTTSMKIEDIFYIEILFKQNLASKYQLFYTVSYKLLSGIILGLLFSIISIFIINEIKFTSVFIIFAFVAGIFASDSNLVMWYLFKFINDKIKPKLHLLSKDLKNDDISKTIESFDKYLVGQSLWQKRDREYYFGILSFATPNQSIKNSFFKGIYMSIVGSITGGILGFLFLISFRLTLELFYGINFEQGWLLSLALSETIMLVFGIEFGLLLGLKSGWGHVINHMILRFWLYCSGVAPLNYRKFLKHCVDLGLMRQVGGGFMFRHRYLQDYFASQYDSIQESS